MKIIDCFMFYNEMDILKYRIEILSPIVDYFILVESTKTFVGKTKPLYYQDNIELFKKYQDKIIYICDTEFNSNPKFNYSRNYNDEIWLNEYHQRNYIEKGIQKIKDDLEDNDIIIISDVDEIPNPDILKYIKENKTEIDCMSLIMTMYYYNLTCVNEQKWYHPKILSYKTYVNIFNRIPQSCRLIETRQAIKNGGWHLSYFGDSDFIQNKILNFSHQEFNNYQYNNKELIKEKIKNKIDLFNRPNEKWVFTPLENNPNLPPKHDIYLSKFLG